MVTLEKALFDINEALHHLGVLTANKYISEDSLIIAIVLTFAFVPLMVKLLDYTKEWDREQKYTPPLIITILLTVLYLSEGVFIILILFIVIGFYIIIATYPQYRHIKEYIESFF